MSRLSGALALSLSLHLAVLSWAVPLSTGSGLGRTGAGPSALRVSLPPAEVENPLPEQEPVPADSPVVQPSEARPDSTPAPEGGRSGPQEEAHALPMLGYHPASSLTRMPEAVGTFDVQPPAEGDAGLAGKITIRIWLSAKGEIDGLRILSSEVPPAYAQAALGAFEKLRFEPAEINGTPVRSWLDVVIEYADLVLDGRRSSGASR